MKRALVTGPPVRDSYRARLSRLGFEVVNGSSAALEILGIPASQRDRDLTEDEMVRLLPKVSVYLYGGLEAASATVLAAGKELELVAFLGTGWADAGCVDEAAARKTGVLVTNTPHANAASVAEIAIGLLISLERQIVPMNARTKKGEGRPIRRRDVAGKTLGIVGLGQIGGRVARHAIRGFDMKVLYAGPNAKPLLERELGVQRVELGELLSQSDYILIQTPAHTTRGLIGHREIARMQPHAMLINLTAPDVVDGEAIVSALEQGKIGGAAFDGTYKEPSSLKERFLAVGDDRLIVLPRSAWLTDDSYDRMADMALESVAALIGGIRPLPFQVSPPVG
jgi:D-3-phosphoglycerate dehydrogenase